MKEAIANVGVFNLMIIFVIILMFFFVGSLGYSKAFKVKNKIIEEIEKNQVYDESVKNDIEKWLGEIGYRYGGTAGAYNCPGSDGAGGTLVSNHSAYQFCVYEHDLNGNVKGNYYKVVAFMYFDFPVIGQMIRVPVSGETKSFVTIEG